VARSATVRLDEGSRVNREVYARFCEGREVRLLPATLLTVETVGLTRLYVFFVIELEHRRVHLAGIAAHPPANGSPRSPATCS
jgi:putative transposase